MPVASDSAENDVASSKSVSIRSSNSEEQSEINKFHQFSFFKDPKSRKHINENKEPTKKNNSFKPRDDSKELQDDESANDDDLDQDVDESSDIEVTVKTDAYQRDYLRKQFKQTNSGRMVRRRTSSVFMNVSSGLRDHQKKPDLIWIFTKMQDFETLKTKYKAATDEIAKLKT